MELQQALTVLDKFVKEWVENVKELKNFRAAIEPEYWDDVSGIPELANDFPIYEGCPEWLEIFIENERKEKLILNFNLDNKEGVQIKFYKKDSDLYFIGDVSIYKSIIKLMYRFPDTIRKYHRQYILLQLKEDGEI